MKRKIKPRIMMPKDKRREKLIAFSWYGGKFSHLDFILPNLPKCHHFVDVYGGSASVILNKNLSKLETYNDINSRLFNFFKQLRKHPDKLIPLLKDSLYSREERGLAISHEENISDLEKARRFFVSVVQSYESQENSGFRIGIKNTNNSKYYYNKVNGLESIYKRLENIIIENAPATEIIQRYNDKKVLLYVDPPYVMEERSRKNCYAFEMTTSDHKEMAELLLASESRFVLSGYRSDLYDKLFKDCIRIDGKSKGLDSSNTGRVRRESLWMNFDPKDQEYDVGYFPKYN